MESAGGQWFTYIYGSSTKGLLLLILSLLVSSRLILPALTPSISTPIDPLHHLIMSEFTQASRRQTSPSLGLSSLGGQNGGEASSVSTASQPQISTLTKGPRRRPKHLYPTSTLFRPRRRSIPISQTRTMVLRSVRSVQTVRAVETAQSSIDEKLCGRPPKRIPQNFPIVTFSH